MKDLAEQRAEQLIHSITQIFVNLLLTLTEVSGMLPCKGTLHSPDESDIGINQNCHIYHPEQEQKFSLLYAD